MSSSFPQTALVIDFFDRQGNSLPQFQINAVLTPSELLSLQNLVTQNFQQAINQIRFSIRGNTDANPTGNASQVYGQIVGIMNTIATLPPNAGFGTVETSTFLGQISGENVEFDIAANNFAQTHLVFTSADFALLQQNPQSGVSVTNPRSTTLQPTMTYQRLEQLLINAGVQQFVSPGTITEAVTTGSNFNITVKNASGQQKQFVISSQDYISLFTTQISSIISADKTSSSVTATLSQVLSFIASSISSTGTVTARQPPTTIGPLLGDGTILVPPSVVPVTPTVQYSNTQLDMTGNDGTTQSFILSTQDAQYILNNYTNNVKNTVSPVNLPVSATAQDVYTFLVHHSSTTNIIPPGFSPQPITPPATVFPPATVLPSHTIKPRPPAKGISYDTTTAKQTFSSNPFGIIGGLFAAGLAYVFVAPKVNLTKHFKTKRSKKR